MKVLKLKNVENGFENISYVQYAPWNSSRICNLLTNKTANASCGYFL